ncbi:MAG: hypothetical protein WDN04_14795 [Rhodospirillales bacterium]
MAAFPIDQVRGAFPGLRHGRIHVDNPAGTQVPRAVADAVGRCLLETNANLGGYFATSRAAGDIVEQGHRDAATLFGAADWRGDRHRPQHDGADFHDVAQPRPHAVARR